MAGILNDKRIVLGITVATAVGIGGFYIYNKVKQRREVSPTLEFEKEMANLRNSNKPDLEVIREHMTSLELTNLPMDPNLTAEEIELILENDKKLLTDITTISSVILSEDGNFKTINPSIVEIANTVDEDGVPINAADLDLWEINYKGHTTPPLPEDKDTADDIPTMEPNQTP